MRVLIDTNILVSASLSNTGTPYQAYIKAVTYPNHGIVCDQNIDELRRVYNRKFPHKIQSLERFLALSLTVLEVVPTPVVDVLMYPMNPLFGTFPTDQSSEPPFRQKQTY